MLSLSFVRCANLGNHPVKTSFMVTVRKYGLNVNSLELIDQVEGGRVILIITLITLWRPVIII